MLLQQNQHQLVPIVVKQIIPLAHVIIGKKEVLVVPTAIVKYIKPLTKTKPQPFKLVRIHV